MSNSAQKDHLFKSRPEDITSRSGGQQDRRDRLRVVGLFAGVGGIELGLSRAGHRAEMLCELDKGAAAVLSRRFEGVDLKGDIGLVPSLPETDLLTAGFPCQDLSQAGRTSGIHGGKSGLIQVAFELVAKMKKKPTWLLLENVPFMLQLERGKGMSYLVKELEGLGYKNWAYRVVNTKSFGLPQRRRRVVLLASSGEEDPRDVLLVDSHAEPKQVPLQQAKAVGFSWTEGIRGLGWAIESVPTLKGGSTIGIPSPPAIWFPTQRHLATPVIEDAERLQGFDAGWTEPLVEASVRPSMRWKLVGNAVSVPVSQWVGERLNAPGTYDDFEDRALESGDPWPLAAWGRGQRAYQADVTEWAGGEAPALLSDFLSFEPKPLSVRATAGFLKRTRDPRTRLRFEKQFIADVEHHLASSKAASSVSD